MLLEYIGVTLPLYTCIIRCSSKANRWLWVDIFIQVRGLLSLAYVYLLPFYFINNGVCLMTSCLKGVCYVIIYDCVCDVISTLPRHYLAIRLQFSMCTCQLWWLKRVYVHICRSCREFCRMVWIVSTHKIVEHIVMSTYTFVAHIVEVAGWCKVCLVEERNMKRRATPIYVWIWLTGFRTNERS